MNQLTAHNDKLKKSIYLLEKERFTELVDLDSIDRILRQFLSIEEMREAGSFFTGQKLAKKAIDLFKTEISSSSIVLDPTCGAGNLLIECSRKLKIKKKLSDTLQVWGKILRGYDIHKAFVDTAKLRIIIEALARGTKNDCSIEDALNFLPNLVVKDAMSVTAEELRNVTHAIMNPPFISWPSPKENYWKQGNVNSAGVVFDKFLRLFPDNCNISTILPDVLRTGSRYQCFRDFVSTQIDAKCHIWGRFSPNTDIDVFILSGIKKTNYQQKISWVTELGNYIPLSKHFNVCVGPLVAYRDPKEGNSYPYFHPKNSPIWHTITTVTESRNFKGRVLNPPFILVKRTSSPSDKYRASATIINLDEPVAIENHMLVITPKSGKLKDCKKLLKILKSEQTNEFLNNRARMRHLTVKTVKEIPLAW